MKPQISIVVPVYKVENCLDRCVQSLMNQTYTAIEIILVDDGSPDRCGMMCDNYAKQDSRISVVHKTNGGLSDARNCGMREAKGDYILFVDSDDYIEVHICEKFIEIINNNAPEIIVGAANRLENNQVIPMQHTLTQQSGVVTGEKFLLEELKAKTMYMVVWMNLYKREFLLHNNLEFKVGLLHEDEQFMPRVFLKAKSVVSTNILFYNYIIREDSITQKKDLSKNGVHIIQTCYELAKIYDELKDDELRRLLDDHLVEIYLCGFKMGRLCRKKYNKLIDKRFLLSRVYSKQNKIEVRLLVINKRIYYLIHIFSIGFFSLLKKMNST
ncbi:glycosyltransferase [Paenibacillus glacialis]|uniref:Glycosyltransferase 2-like domain-containing protein n=1 Tax=Paenibacillus glacialis TaxID=494026 RepID=A0A168FBF5_9BACL|nr:glycosyltransferase [Paenibacillus glacialis]OAB36046.1 hypothetical protein PGLA_21765 [Paenibacillus glacialis]